VPSVLGLFEEAVAIVSKFFDPISAFPLHVYYTALPLSSTGTVLYQTYEGELRSIERKVLDKAKRVNNAIAEIEWYVSL
jgi:hypothetical protein